MQLRGCPLHDSGNADGSDCLPLHKLPQTIGSPYSVNLIVRTSAMSVDGALATYLDRDTESGEPLAREFCAQCGSPIRSVPSAAKMVAVKAGTLEQPDGFAPTMHIWTRSALPWVEIPSETPQFEKEPQR